MVRTPCCDQNGLKKGTWTPEEDRKLVAYVTRYGCWNWRLLPKFAGLARCGKSCRLRWMNYLRPDIKRGNYTRQEEDTIVRLHQKLGDRWSAIAAHLPGRTDNGIKNYWHTNLKKRFKQKSDTHGKAKVFKPKDQFPFESRQQIRDSVANSTTTAPSSQSDSIVAESQVSDTFPVPSTDTGASSSNENFVGEDYDNLPFLDAFIETMSENFWTEPYMVDISYVPNEALVPLSTGYSYEYNARLWEHNNLFDEYIGLF